MHEQCYDKVTQGTGNEASLQSDKQIGATPSWSFGLLGWIM